jgi:hypothetical protein
MPAISTVHAVLDRHGLVKRRRRRHHASAASFLSQPTEPNALWCADYKGEFRLGNRICSRVRRCRTHKRPSRSPSSHKGAGRVLRALTTRLSRLAGPHLSVPRHDDDRHQLRPAVFQRAEGESESCPGGAERGRHPGRRRIWLVSFMQYDLGYFDEETCRLEPIQNPFGSKVYLCLRPE